MVRLADRRLLVLMVVFFFLHVAAEMSYAGWIASYAVATDLANVTDARLLTSAFWGAFTLSRLLSIPIAIRFRPGTILLGGLLGCVASLSIILLLPDSSTALWLGTIGMGISIAPLFATSISLTLLARHGGPGGGLELGLLRPQLIRRTGPYAVRRAHADRIGRIEYVARVRTTAP